MLLGLNPNAYYLLNDTPRDFSQVHINDLPEGVSVTESRVTENTALFRLERTSAPEKYRFIVTVSSCTDGHLS